MAGKQTNIKIDPARFSDALKASGLKQKEIAKLYADAAGVSPEAGSVLISRIKKSGSVSYEKLNQLCDLLNVSAGYLTGKVKIKDISEDRAAFLREKYGNLKEDPAGYLIPPRAFDPSDMQEYIYTAAFALVDLIRNEKEDHTKYDPYDIQKIIHHAIDTARQDLEELQKTYSS